MVLDYLIMIQPKFKSELLEAVDKLIEDVADYDLRYATVRFVRYHIIVFIYIQIIQICLFFR